jgi:hypothetical protein
MGYFRRMSENVLKAEFAQVGGSFSLAIERRYRQHKE